MEIVKYSRPLKGEEEFKRLKEYEPFKSIRQIAKSANFSLLFGASAFTFMKNSLEPVWSLDQADAFIKLNKLEELKDEVIESFIKRNRPVPYSSLSYLVCATFIRNMFFKKYPGLLNRIARNTEIIKEKGYTRTYHGVIRRLPMLMLAGENDDYKDISGNINIGANSEIQSLEASLVMSCVVEFMLWARRNKYKSKIWNSVHDSVDFYLYEPELEIIIPKVFEIFQKIAPWKKGIPLTIDFNIADLDKGDFYKGGMDARKYLDTL